MSSEYTLSPLAADALEQHFASVYATHIKVRLAVHAWRTLQGPQFPTVRYSALCSMSFDVRVRVSNAHLTLG